MTLPDHPPRQVVSVGDLDDDIILLVEAAEVLTEEPYDLTDPPDIGAKE